jgi:flavin reductase (DIM6/NTAB) family NADH-FMN oxidoreductase RutF
MKKNLGAVNALSPILTTVIGTEVDGKINYFTVAYVGIIDQDVLSISVNKIRYSNQGIKKHGTLSVNLPSIDMAVEADYVGRVSGAKVDKSQVFESFLGSLKGSPMIKNAPISMECEVIDILDRPNTNVYLVKVVNTYCNENVMTDGKIDYAKVDPMFFDLAQIKYRKLGEKFADSYSLGKEYNKSK